MLTLTGVNAISADVVQIPPYPAKIQIGDYRVSAKYIYLVLDLRVTIRLKIRLHQ